MANQLPDEADFAEAREVLRFWFGEAPEYGTRLKRWFEKDPAFDAQIGALYAALRDRLALGAAKDWLETRADCLAYIIVLDQFSRHIYRGTARAFDADALALQVARQAVERGYEKGLRPVERLFVCLPFQHSEALVDQHAGCTLAAALREFPETKDVYRFAL